MGSRALAGAALAAAALAGCGGGGPSGPTPQEARAKLQLACLQGSHDKLDRRLCRCIVREAARRPEYDTPAKLVALSRRTQSGAPAALGAVARRCADRIAGG